MPMTAKLAVFLIAAGAAAQTVSRPEGLSARFTAGMALQYPDEPWVRALGASVRIRLYRRFSLEPEFAAAGSVYRQWTVIPNLVVDLRDRRQRVVPYLIGGAGYLHELDTRIHYERSDWIWNAGVGFRVRAGKRVFVSPEFRIGGLARAAVSIGYFF
jgi:hypothetical protein